MSVDFIGLGLATQPWFAEQTTLPAGAFTVAGKFHWHHRLAWHPRRLLYRTRNCGSYLPLGPFFGKCCCRRNDQGCLVHGGSA